MPYRQLLDELNQSVLKTHSYDWGGAVCCYFDIDVFQQCVCVWVKIFLQGGCDDTPSPYMMITFLLIKAGIFNKYTVQKNG